MKRFNVDRFLVEKDEFEWYRVPDSTIKNLNLNDEELEFAKKLYVGYDIKREEVNIPAERILEIIQYINDDLGYESDGFMVLILPHSFRMMQLEGSLKKVFWDSEYKDYMEEVE